MSTVKTLRQNIGPSHFSAILGLNSFKTLEDIQEEIEIGFIRNEASNPAMSMGIAKETEVIKLYEKIKEKKVKNAHWVRSGKQNRILAKADGLIDKDGGIEIKCHYGKDKALSSVPLYHLVQVLGYLHLYKREWWDLVSCCFNEAGDIGNYRIHRIYWKDYSKPWLEFYYPQIEDFIGSVNWTQP